MKFNEFYKEILENINTGKNIVSEEKRRLDPKCWKGYRKAGTKLKGGVRVNKCVKIKK